MEMGNDIHSQWWTNTEIVEVHDHDPYVFIGICTCVCVKYFLCWLVIIVSEHMINNFGELSVAQHFVRTTTN